MSAVVDRLLAIPLALLDIFDWGVRKFEKFRSGENFPIVFGFLFFTYFLVASGVIYDIIVEPPSIGNERDPNTGMVKPQAIMPYRINGQYMIEGFSAGFLYCLGGGAFILLNRAMASKETSAKYIQIGIGLVIGFIAYSMCNVFIRIKMPGYGIMD